MKTIKNLLEKGKKGDSLVINGLPTVVAGEATLSTMSRKRGEGPFVVVPNSPTIRMLWTADGQLIFRGPRYEKGPEVYFLFARADVKKTSMAKLVQEAARFGTEFKQDQNTVSLPYDGQEFWYTDVGCAGSADIPKDNEKEVVNGASCLRFYHLVTNVDDDGAQHLMYLGPQPQENVFTNLGGSVWETLWIGTIVNPEDIIEFDE